MWLRMALDIVVMRSTLADDKTPETDFVMGDSGIVHVLVRTSSEVNDIQDSLTSFYGSLA